MKEKLAGFLKSKSFYVIFSIFLSVIAWLLVVKSNNPVEFRTLEVPITSVNQKTLSQNDLVNISTTSLPTSVTVKIKGNSKLIEMLQPNDFYAEADFQNVTEPGNYTIKIKEPTYEALGVSVESYYPKEFQCAYDKKVERYMDVTVNWDETLTGENLTIINAVAEPATILLTGFSMELDEIDKVEVNLADSFEAGSIKADGATSLVCRFINAAGDDISYLFDTEKVTVRFSVGKIVPIQYALTGTPAANYYVASHSASPNTVTLTGAAATLANINAIRLENISVQGLSASFERELKLSSYLPAGVTAHNAETVRVSVNIQPFGTKTLSLDPAKLIKTGENAAYQYEYQLLQNEVTVRGKAADINALQADSVKYSVDVTDRTDGTYELEVQFTGTENLYIVGTVQCRVTVTPVTTPSPSETEAPSPTPAATAAPTESPEPAEPETSVH